jgi:hypothetical protein
VTDPSRPHDVTGLTTPELDRARRELAASLALSRPGSPARDVIAAHIAVVDTERAQRPGAGQAGRPGSTSLPAPVSVVTPASPPPAANPAGYPDHGAGSRQSRRSYGKC